MDVEPLCGSLDASAEAMRFPSLPTVHPGAERPPWTRHARPCAAQAKSGPFRRMLTQRDRLALQYGDLVLFDIALPQGVVLEEVPAGDEAPLLPEEEALLGLRAVDRRRTDVAVGRTAARRALSKLGLPKTPIGRGALGEPLWPAGAVGSITHAAGIGLAAAALDDRFAGIGLDLEHADRYFAGLEDEISFGAERDELGTPPDGRDVVELFAVKEATYKALSPLVGRYFGFEAAQVRRVDGAPTVTLREDLDDSYVTGTVVPVTIQWSGDLVLAVVAIPAD